jgi:hypothetical protein
MTHGNFQFTCRRSSRQISEKSQLIFVVVIAHDWKGRRANDDAATK